MLKIGSGAGFSGDRVTPALELASKVDLDYLVLECLAERTIASAQKAKKQNPNLGYDPFLVERMEGLLPILNEKRFRVISNMGAANPEAAAEKILEIANKLKVKCKVAIVTGDDVVNQLVEDQDILENDKKVGDYTNDLLSANAYLGVSALLPAIESDADIIITGRVADPSLFLAPMVHHFEWELNDYEMIGRGTVIGHLLECAGQITGGYFAEPNRKEVVGLEDLGFPYATIDRYGSAIISKAENTGGLINVHTVKEQLLYEVHNPKEYLTPDVSADFSTVKIEEIEPNKVKVIGGSGKEKPMNLKVSLGYLAGFLGEGEISYAGSTSLERARLAEDIIKKRLINEFPDLRTDLIGVSAVHRTNFGHFTPYEVRVRAAALAKTDNDAKKIGNEVEALYTNGPCGGGGARKKTSECIGVVSTFVSRELVNQNIKVEVKENELKNS